MEFDVSKVYTSVNADELKVGSKVFCAFSLSDLKKRVDEGDEITEVFKIFPDSMEHRINVYYKDGYFSYPLAYLVEEPEEKKLKVADLKLGDILTPKYDEEKTRYFSITGIDYEYNKCFFNNGWYTNEGLIAWEKVES